MKNLIVEGTLREEIIDRLTGTPTESIFNPNHETVIRYVQQSTPDWLEHAYHWTDKRGKHIAMPPTQIPGTKRQGSLLSLDDGSPFPSRYWDRIGQSGWDHINQCARYLTCEFDGANHQDALSQDQLDLVRDRLSNHPAVDLRRSTSGLGLHARLFVAPIPCQSRKEYLHVRKEGVKSLAEQVNIPLDWFDLGGRGNLWIWKGGAE